MASNSSSSGFSYASLYTGGGGFSTPTAPSGSVTVSTSSTPSSSGASSSSTTTGSGTSSSGSGSSGSSGGTSSVYQGAVITYDPGKNETVVTYAPNSGAAGMSYTFKGDQTGASGRAQEMLSREFERATQEAYIKEQLSGGDPRYASPYSTSGMFSAGAVEAGVAIAKQTAGLKPGESVYDPGSNRWILNLNEGQSSRLGSLGYNMNVGSTIVLPASNEQRPFYDWLSVGSGAGYFALDRAASERLNLATAGFSESTKPKVDLNPAIGQDPSVFGYSKERLFDIDALSRYKLPFKEGDIISRESLSSGVSGELPGQAKAAGTTSDFKWEPVTLTGSALGKAREEYIRKGSADIGGAALKGEEARSVLFGPSQYEQSREAYVRLMKVGGEAVGRTLAGGRTLEEEAARRVNVRPLDYSGAVRLNQVLGLYDIARGEASGPVTRSATVGDYEFKDLNDPLVDYVLTGKYNSAVADLAFAARQRMELEARAGKFGASTGLERARLIGEGLLTSESLDLIKAGLVGSKEDIDRSLGRASVKLGGARGSDWRLLGEFSQSAPGLYTMGVASAGVAGLAGASVPALASGLGARAVAAGTNVGLALAGQAASGRRDVGELGLAAGLGLALPASGKLASGLLPGFVLGLPAVVPALKLYGGMAPFTPDGERYSLSDAVGEYGSGVAFTGLLAAGAVAGARAVPVLSRLSSSVGSRLFDVTPVSEVSRTAPALFDYKAVNVGDAAKALVLGSGSVQAPVPKGYAPADYSPDYYTVSKPVVSSGGKLVADDLDVRLLAGSLKKPGERILAEGLLREQLRRGEGFIQVGPSTNTISFKDMAPGSVTGVQYARAGKAGKFKDVSYAEFLKLNPDTRLYKPTGRREALLSLDAATSTGMAPSVPVGEMRFVELSPADKVGMVSDVRVVGAGLGSRSGGSQVFSGKAFSFKLDEGLYIRQRVGQGLASSSKAFDVFGNVAAVESSGLTGSFVRAPSDVSTLKFSDYAVYRGGAVESFSGAKAGGITSYGRFSGEGRPSIKPVFESSGLSSELVGYGVLGSKAVATSKDGVQFISLERGSRAFDVYGGSLGSKPAFEYTPEGFVSSRIYGAKAPLRTAKAGEVVTSVEGNWVSGGGPVGRSFKPTTSVSGEVPISEFVSRLESTRSPGATLLERARASVPREVVLSRGVLGGEPVVLRSSKDVGFYTKGGLEFTDVYKGGGALSTSKEFSSTGAWDVIKQANQKSIFDELVSKGVKVPAPKTQALNKELGAYTSDKNQLYKEYVPTEGSFKDYLRNLVTREKYLAFDRKRAMEDAAWYAERRAKLNEDFYNRKPQYEAVIKPIADVKIASTEVKPVTRSEPMPMFKAEPTFKTTTESGINVAKVSKGQQQVQLVKSIDTSRGDIISKLEQVEASRQKSLTEKLLESKKPRKVVIEEEDYLPLYVRLPGEPVRVVEEVGTGRLVEGRSSVKLSEEPVIRFTQLNQPVQEQLYVERSLEVAPTESYNAESLRVGRLGYGLGLTVSAPTIQRYVSPVAMVEASRSASRYSEATVPLLSERVSSQQVQRTVVAPLSPEPVRPLAAATGLGIPTTMGPVVPIPPEIIYPKRKVVDDRGRQLPLRVVRSRRERAVPVKEVRRTAFSDLLNKTIAESRILRPAASPREEVAVSFGPGALVPTAVQLRRPDLFRVGRRVRG